MGFYDAFFGSEQSQYTAYAIFAAIIAICITILLTATDVPVSNRLLIIFFVIISLVPSVFLTLFELTCIVTGGTEPNQWWCYAFAWVLAAFIIIYCIFIVIISLISLFTYNNAIDNVKMNEDNNRLSPEVSNNYAKKIIETDDIHTKKIEQFYADMNNYDSSSMAPPSVNNKEQTNLDPMASLMNLGSAGPEGFANNNEYSLSSIPSLSSTPSMTPSMPSFSTEPTQTTQQAQTTQTTQQAQQVQQIQQAQQGEPIQTTDSYLTPTSTQKQEPVPVSVATKKLSGASHFSNYNGGNGLNDFDDYYSINNFDNNK